ncbi:10588_t:CDS:2, partial [Racocetra persica]
SMDSKLEAKKLPCVFTLFAEKYPESDLLKHIEKCKPEENQYWRNALANMVVKRTTEMLKVRDLAKETSTFGAQVDSLKNI